MTGVLAALAGGGLSPYRDFAGGVIDHTTISPSNASALFTLQPDGTCTVGAGNLPSTKPNWYTPTTVGIGSSHWCQAVINSGSFSSGSTALQLIGGGVSWTRQQSTVGGSSVNFTLNIYADAGGTILVASKSITLQATKDA